MKRKTAVKFMMGLGWSRNAANSYLDDWHRNGFTNNDACYSALSGWYLENLSLVL